MISLLIIDFLGKRNLFAAHFFTPLLIVCRKVFFEYALYCLFLVYCVLKIGTPVVSHHLCVSLTENGFWDFSIQVLVDNFHVIRYDGRESYDLIV